MTTERPESALPVTSGLFERVLGFSLQHGWLVMLAVAAMAVLGVWSYQRLPIDAVPDITNVQVQINTEAPGIPRRSRAAHDLSHRDRDGRAAPARHTRSISRYGLSQVTVIFHDGTDIYFARQLVTQRIQEAQRTCRRDWTPTMGPICYRLGRDLHVDGRGGGGCTNADGSPYRATDLRKSRTGSSGPQLRMSEALPK